MIACGMNQGRYVVEKLLLRPEIDVYKRNQEDNNAFDRCVKYNRHLNHGMFNPLSISCELCLKNIFEQYLKLN